MFNWVPDAPLKWSIFWPYIQKFFFLPRKLFRDLFLLSIFSFLHNFTVFASSFSCVNVVAEFSTYSQKFSLVWLVYSPPVPHESSKAMEQFFLCGTFLKMIWQLQNMPLTTSKCWACTKALSYSILNFQVK